MNLNPFKKAAEKVLGPKVVTEGAITHVGDSVRIESGPKILTAEVATVELLSNEATAKHYQVGMPDALGKPIRLGEPMTYAAWGGTKQPAVIEFKVYRLERVPTTHDPAKTRDVWALKGARDSLPEALALAKSIYGA